MMMQMIKINVLPFTIINSFLKHTEQMTELFSDLPEAIDNTNEIVDKVELVSVTNDLLLPNFPVPTTF
jgi:DNA polymerase-3 subunit alpha